MDQEVSADCRGVRRTSVQVIREPDGRNVFAGRAECIHLGWALVVTRIAWLVTEERVVVEGVGGIVDVLRG